MVYPVGQTFVPQSVVIVGSASHTPFTGCGVSRHRFSKAPEKSCTPKIPYTTIRNIRKIATLARAGSEIIKEPTSAFMPKNFDKC